MTPNADSSPEASPIQTAAPAKASPTALATVIPPPAATAFVAAVPSVAPAPATNPPPSATRAAPRLWLPVVQRGDSLVATAAPPPHPTLVSASFPTPLTPRPSSTPSPIPKPVTKVTKWGVGVYRGGGPYVQALLETKPTVILLLDPDANFVRDVRHYFPKAFIVGRVFLTEVDQRLHDPAGRGTAFADRVAATAVPLKGAVDAWMSYNEVVGTNNYEQYRAYNAFQVAFTRRLRGTHGVDVVAANDGSATVEPEDYARYFSEAIRESAYFGVHAYSPLGSRTMKQDSEWHALRYRKIHRALQGVGLGDTKFVITESGLGDGWRDRVGEEDMAADFAWFSDELERDAHMIGHVAFGIFGDGTWRPFDLMGTSIMTRLGAYAPPGGAR